MDVISLHVTLMTHKNCDVPACIPFKVRVISLWLKWFLWGNNMACALGLIINISSIQLHAFTGAQCDIRRVQDCM